MSKGGEWFYSKQGQQQGPVTFEELVELAKAGDLDPRSDLVWGPKMQNWAPSGEVKGLFERRKVTGPVPTIGPAPAQSSGGMNTGATPYVSSDAEDNHYGVSADALPGVNRGGYFFATLILPVLIGVIIAKFAYHNGQHNEMLAPALLAFGVLVSLFVTFQRLVNLGMNRLWILGFLIPLLNVWLGYRVFACPPGYAYGRKMDGVGIFLAILYWLGAIATCLMLLLSAGAIIKGAQDPKVKEKIAPIQRQVGELLEKLGDKTGEKK